MLIAPRKADHEQTEFAEAFPQPESNITELHRHDLPRQRHPHRRSPDHRAAADPVIERPRVIDQPRVSGKLREPDYESEKEKSREQCITPDYRKTDEQTIIDDVSAAPVRQSDHGANVSSETAITLMTIVAITTHKRPRSRAVSCVFVRDMMPL